MMHQSASGQICGWTELPCSQWPTKQEALMFFITVERKSCDSAISFPVFLQRDTFVYSFLLLHNINMPDLNVNGEDITSYF